MASIKKHLKKTDETEKKLLQARVDADLYEKFQAKAKKEGHYIQDVVEAMMKAYLEEK